MSGQNLDAVRRYYDAFNRGDWAGMTADFAPDFAYISSGVYIVAERTHLGLASYRRFLDQLFGEFEAVRAQVHELVDAEDRVLASALIRGRAKQSGVETNWYISHVWSLRSGTIIGAQGFADRAQALQAAGVPSTP